MTELCPIELLGLNIKMMVGRINTRKINNLVSELRFIMSTDTYHSNLLKVMLTVPISNLNLYVHSWCFTFLYVFNVLQIPVTYVNVRVMTVCALIADLKKIFKQQHFDD